ncbi:late secretory pathway protein avl9, variant 2 [Orbilia oligospora]|uniref:Late secretory pathway protein avl9 n=2 Tax=Orbilia oligospora TaxID=2813651 RepID=A0A7C8RLZ2_ORBOL|nr:late secretory pathway protein avl9 [Orbilia oligospora]KAF3289821.1 late secretory pathway protein avl9, variant 2 [Orbilia oligospora]
MTKPRQKSFPPIVSIVGFHHAKGPDVEHWFGGDEDLDDVCTDAEWPFFPFMALCDGSHSFEQDFSYFTLKREPRGDRPASSLFGISCTMQLDSRLLKERSAEVTRSTVQKAVVVITDSPVYFGHLREQLVMVTSAWFAQRNFDDLEIIKKFRESLVRSICGRDDGFDRETYLGLSLREFIYRFRHNALVLFKCALLQPKMLFFSSKSCEKLCMTQFALVSLVPGLLEKLQDASDPELNDYEETREKAVDLKTSDRHSLLAYMGCPLQIFGKGSLFGPYTPLQQLDMLADQHTKSYIVGSTNSLLLQQKDRYSDIIVNLDDLSLNITSSSLRAALTLTPADKRWINSLSQTVVDSWDENDPSRPKTMAFTGSEDFIRMQFEEYILALLSSVKYSTYVERHADDAILLAEVDGDPSADFGVDWVHHWKTTENYRIFEKFTEDNIFDVIPPRHVYAGARAYEDLTRRINQQMAELKINEKMAAVTQTFATGSRKVSTAINTLWADIEKARKERDAAAKQLEEMERLNAELAAHEELRLRASRPGSIRTDVSSLNDPSPTPSPLPPDTVAKDKEPENHAQSQSQNQNQNQTTIPSRASSYFSSWASWAGEKRRKAFTSAPQQDSQSVKSPTPSIMSSQTHPEEEYAQLSNGSASHKSNSSFDGLEMVDVRNLDSSRRSIDTVGSEETGKTKGTNNEDETGSQAGIGGSISATTTVVEMESIPDTTEGDIVDKKVDEPSFVEVVIKEEKEEVDVPATPVTAVPNTPVTAVPNTPITAVPDTPVTAVPNTPVTAVPDTPVTPVPDTPVTIATPKTPITAIPDTPVVTSPIATTAAATTTVQ